MELKEIANDVVAMFFAGLGIGIVIGMTIGYLHMLLMVRKKLNE